MKAQRAMISMLAAVLIIGPSVVKAQGPTGTQEAACTIDLSEANALMTKAQSQGSAGKVNEALVLINQVRQKLDEVTAKCGAAGTIALTEQYVDPTGTFSVSYPTGWVTQLIADTPAEKARGAGPILFASDAAAFDMIANSKVGIKARGIVVYIGPSGQLLEQLGVRGVSKAVNPLNAMTLLQRVVMGQSSGDGQFGTPTQGAAIKDYATAEVTFTFNASNSGSKNPVADGNVLLMQLGADQFAVLVGFAPPGEGKAIGALSRKMAETLQSPPVGK